MEVETVILPCDPYSISFEEHGENVIPVISSLDTRRALEDACSILKKGLQPIAFPTETVYGLGALALNHDAVLRIFSTKGRPADNPLIVHVSTLSMLKRILPPSYTLSPLYQSLIKSFWPGPLTLLFPITHSSLIPTSVTAGHETVAIRIPSHPIARALIALCDEPLAAPSANSSGRPSPTRAEHVYRDLNGKIKCILDGGPSQVGLESTDGHLRVLRPGGITVEQLESVVASHDESQDGARTRQPTKVLVHRRDYKDEDIEAAPTTPGMKYRHYAPSSPVILLMDPSRLIVELPLSLTETGQKPIAAQTVRSFLAALFSSSDRRSTKLGLLLTSDSPYLTPFNAALSTCTFYCRHEYKVHLLGTSNTPQVTAQRLFDGLLSLDNDGVDVIIAESIPETHEGLAIMNRVRKAAGETRYVLPVVD
ncbi:DHBP synthase RibB-like alpha/beta domain-containing protein [Cantharellus anzutake]|uniref:DHBP synthase RibB-like alpha/beta domain-containing protein n=1 Tax=Cantharellus anzutake TaxID=1750568 RepID=UPI001908B0E9|nr:DHBP synthase RibB-like alpha/beta domain-containing protein [Cantharellus anzutake]KAF8330397.1 DHBP synthase RibB-like alpha/beta domain-containing protein [Cantharellus anzutake]